MKNNRGGGPLHNTIQGDTYLKELFGLIESVKGIGPVIATEILIITNEFKDITEAKKFACHAGVVPFDGAARAAPIRKIQRAFQNQPRRRTAIRLIKNSKHYSIMGPRLLFNRFGGPNSKEIKEYYIRKTSQGKNEIRTAL